jgi:alpha-galactosidase
MNYKIIYEVDGKRYVNESEFLKITLTHEPGKTEILLHPRKGLRLLKAEMTFDDSIRLGEKFFSNGYQTWTDSQEQGFCHWTRRLGLLAKVPQIENKYHLKAFGDYSFIHYHPHYSFSYTYLRHKDDFRLYGSLSEREGFTVFFLKGHKLKAYKDIEGLKIEKDYKIFSIFHTEGKEKEVFDAYASSFNRPFNAQPTPKGFTTWYRHYDKVTEADILKDLQDIKAQKPDMRFFQIDDGYQIHAGDWLTLHEDKFPHGMKYLAEAITAQGLIPGIWMAPFTATYDSALLKDHPDWFKKDKEGKPLPAGSAWGGAYCLDSDNPEVRSYLAKVFQAYKDMGYRLFKLDFLYACCLTPSETKSRGQLMTEAMEFIREQLQGCYILGCGVPLFPAFYNVDFCRIGCDVGLTWDDKWFMRLLHRERISTKWSLRNTYYRRQLNGRFFYNDPDAVFLSGTQMNKCQKDKLYQIDKTYGGFYFTSDDISQWGEKELAKWKEL